MIADKGTDHADDIVLFLQIFIDMIDDEADSFLGEVLGKISDGGQGEVHCFDLKGGDQSLNKSLFRG